jgi:hypothetical protein
MKKTIIGINGIKRSGKDTAANYLRDKLRADVTTLYWAGLLKELAAIALGLPDHYFFDDKAKDEKFLIAPGVYMTGRELLQKIGTDCFRNIIHEDFWIQRTVAAIKASYSDFILIPDTRFPNEYDKIKELGGYVIKVLRPQVETGDTHISEMALDGYTFDAVIDNSGPYHGPAFRNMLDDFINKVREDRRK